MTASRILSPMRVVAVLLFHLLTLWGKTLGIHCEASKFVGRLTDEAFNRRIRLVLSIYGQHKKWGVFPTNLFCTYDPDDTRLLADSRIVQHEILRH